MRRIAVAGTIRNNLNLFPNEDGIIYILKNEYLTCENVKRFWKFRQEKWWYFDGKTLQESTNEDFHFLSEEYLRVNPIKLFTISVNTNNTIVSVCSTNTIVEAIAITMHYLEEQHKMPRESKQYFLVSLANTNKRFVIHGEQFNFLELELMMVEKFIMNI